MTGDQSSQDDPQLGGDPVSELFAVITLLSAYKIITEVNPDDWDERTKLGKIGAVLAAPLKLVAAGFMLVCGVTMGIIAIVTALPSILQIGFSKLADAYQERAYK